MGGQEKHCLFNDLLATHQSRLYGYLFALVRNRADAEDLFQATCLTLWQRFDTFQPGTNFYAWAVTTANNLARNFLKRKRPVRAGFSEELLDAIADTEHRMRQDDEESFLAALRDCMNKLDVNDRELIDLPYVKNLAAGEIAAQMGRSRQSVCNSLSRIRRQLLECVERRLSQEDRP